MRIVLWALALLYGTVTRLRNLLYDRKVLSIYKSSLPVISIGNITAGGNGKTPLALAIVKELKGKGRKPVILSRGYRGSLKGPHLVSPGDTYLEVGDEPLLMAAETEVVIARDRVAGAKFIEGLGRFDLIVLDDGFQHRRLARDIDIVTIDIGSTGATEAFVEGAMLPLGRFREARDAALQRASIIVLSERGFASGRDVPEAFKGLLPKETPTFRSSIIPGGAVSVTGKALEPPASVIAFCAIASPEPFFTTLRTYGFTVEQEVSFPDHHAFNRSDLERLRTLSEGKESRPLVCTVKDAVKIGDRNLDNLYLFTISTEVVPHDRFFEEIDAVIGGAVR